MTLIQLLIAGFAALVLFRTLVSLKRKKISLAEFIFWAAIWGAVMMVAFLPGITTFLSEFLGVGRGVDVAVYFSILLLFFLLYRIIIRLEKIDYQITQIVRRQALKGKNEE